MFDNWKRFIACVLIVVGVESVFSYMGVPFAITLALCFGIGFFSSTIFDDLSILSD